MKIAVISATLVVLAALFIWWHMYKGLPKSLSQMVKASPKWKYAFAGVLGVYAVTTWLGCADRLPDEWLWLLWLTELSLLFVTVTPITEKDSIQIHTGAAVLSAIAITFLAMVLCPSALLVWFIYVIYTMTTDCEYKKLIAELVCGIVLLLVVIV